MTSYDRFYAFAAEIDANVTRVREAAEAARQETLRHDIPGGLGTVTVDGTGRLHSVEPERRALQVSSGRALADQVCRAIGEAESMAAAQYRERVGQVQRTTIFH